MKYPIIFSTLFFASIVTTSVTAQNTQTNNQPQGTSDYPAQKNGESESMGQEKKQPLTVEQKAQKHADFLQKKLGLSEEQKTQVYDLNFSRITKSKALREKNKTNENKQATKEEFQKIRTDYDAGLKNVLNDDQEKAWAQLKADAKAKKEAHHQQKSNGKKPAPKTTPVEEDPDGVEVD